MTKQHELPLACKYGWYDRVSSSDPCYFQTWQDQTPIDPKYQPYVDFLARRIEDKGIGAILSNRLVHYLELLKKIKTKT